MATASAANAARKAEAAAPGRILINGVKAVADLGVLPGASLLAEGDVKSGTLHAVTGLLAGAILGPIGWFAVGADSFSLSVSGKHIYQHFVSVQKVDE
jgi:hypothetical protein